MWQRSVDDHLMIGSAQRATAHAMRFCSVLFVVTAVKLWHLVGQALPIPAYSGDQGLEKEQRQQHPLLHLQSGGSGPAFSRIQSGTVFRRDSLTHRCIFVLIQNEDLDMSRMRVSGIDAGSV